MRVTDFLEDNKGGMWISTLAGLFYYNRRANRLDHYTTKEGLSTNQCYNMVLDKKGDLYVAGIKGFNVLSDGKISSYTRDNGLKYDYCEGILLGNDNKIWLANTKCIIRFDPDKKTMQYFDENSGFSTEGFRFGSCQSTRGGELFWGSRKGINYFYPGELVNHPADIRLNISQAETPDSTFYLGSNNSVSLNYRNNTIVFRFAAINLRGSRNVQYQYQLEGYDKDWQNAVDIRQARYPSLPAGRYVFRVRASVDRVNWVTAPAEINVRIIPPIWQQWWFLGAVFAAITGIIYWIIYSRNRKIEEQKEEIETEQAVTYLPPASLINRPKNRSSGTWRRTVSAGCNLKTALYTFWTKKKIFLFKKQLMGEKARELSRSRLRLELRSAKA